MRAFLVGLLPLAAAHDCPQTVSTPAALRDAIRDGAHIEVVSDMVIDEEIVIPAGYDVEIMSKNRATLFATSSASHFRIDGKLRLDNLVLTNGSATYNFCSYNDDGTGDSCGGGALHVDEDAKLILVDCVIANSTGRYGGGLYAYKSDVEIYGTTFEGNQIRSEAGGAIYTQWHKSLKIAESKFVSNSAPKAGALFLGGDTEIFDTQFVGNKAACLVGNVHGTVGCWGGEGGGIWLNSGATTISGSTFVNNEATKDGPAIHVYAATANLAVVSTTFQGNIGNGTVADISYAKLNAGPPVIDCEASCDNLGGGTCAPVDCIGCPKGDGPCDGATCSCYSCDCLHPSLPTPQPTGPSPSPTVSLSNSPWWQSSCGGTDFAARIAASPLAVAAVLVIALANVAAASRG